MLNYLVYREHGYHKSSTIKQLETARRTYALELSPYKKIMSPHGGGVYSLDIDKSEGRYLLSGGLDACIGVYDVQPSLNSSMQQIEPLFAIQKGSKGAHLNGISSVLWYPHDNGLFITSSFDKSIRLWDPNTAQVIKKFQLPEPVYACSISDTATSHYLIAAGTGGTHPLLCDIRSGNATHVLIGHREAVWTVKWCPGNDFLLATGSMDKTIRLWDIRKAGCLACLDQHGSPEVATHDDKFQLPSNEKLGKGTLVTSHNGAVTSLCFTPDGHYLLSTGTDSKLICWNLATGMNTLVNYTGTVNHLKHGNQIAVSSNGSVVYHPNGSFCINAYVIHSGDLIRSMPGHFDTVNCCIFHPFKEELYSGGLDRQILTWTPVMDGNIVVETVNDDKDSWSDEEKT